MAATLDFVDSIAASPGVRLNLGDGTTWKVALDGTAFPPPPLNYVVASSMLRDGAVIPSATYELRRITLDLLVDATTADAEATALQNLYKELDRPDGNILRYKDNTTNPVFFRTHRASPTQVDIRPGEVDGKRHRVIVELMAEPAGFGPLQAATVSGNLDTNPANSNGCFIDVTGVIGDIDTPALIKWPASAVVAGRETVIATKRKSPSGAPFTYQAEAMTLGTDTTLPGADALMSGGGSSYARTSFATNANMVTRLTLSDLGTAGVNLRGRYRVYARVRRSSATGIVNVRIQWGASGGMVTTNPAKATALTTNICYVELGEIQIPRGQDPKTFGDGVDIPVSDVYHLAVQEERVSGSSTFDVDLVQLVAADDRMAIVKWVEAGPSYWWLDADKPSSSHARNASDQIQSAQPPTISSKLPMLTPGVTNRIYILPETAAGLALAFTTITVAVSYYPRYLRDRPAAT